MLTQDYSPYQVANGKENPVFTRLSVLHPPLAALLESEDPSLPAPQSASVRSHIISDGDTLRQSYGLLTGIAAQVRVMGNGRRQILRLISPGEIFGALGKREVIAPITTIALTPITFVEIDLLVMATGALGSAMHHALFQNSTLAETLAFNQIMRLGRLTAYERIAHLFLELRDRFDLSGLCTQNSYALPLTQEMLADLVGLTSVHVNRRLRQLRREELLDVSGGVVSILDYKALAWIAEYKSLT